MRIDITTDALNWHIFIFKAIFHKTNPFNISENDFLFQSLMPFIFQNDAQFLSARSCNNSQNIAISIEFV